MTWWLVLAVIAGILIGLGIALGFAAWLLRDLRTGSWGPKR